MNDRGWATLWILGMCVAVLFLGGVSLDLWRVFEVRGDLVAMADSAANSGASQIDIDHFRATGEVVLDTELALAHAGATLVAHQDFERTTGSPSITPDGPFLTVELEADVSLSLLGMFLDDRRLTVGAIGVAQAIASP